MAMPGWISWKSAQDGWQNLDADDLAGRDPHDAAFLLGVAGRRADEDLRRTGHGAGHRRNGERRRGGPEAGAGPGEEGPAEQSRLQRLDMSRYRRLGETEAPRGG